MYYLMFKFVCLKELFIASAVLLVGIMGPSFYLACNVQEYNGKAQARREAGDV
jgi:hypothetical protein